MNQPKSQKQITNKTLIHKSTQIRKCFNQLNLKKKLNSSGLRWLDPVEAKKKRKRVTIVCKGKRERGCATCPLRSEKGLCRTGPAIAACRLGFAWRLEAGTPKADLQTVDLYFLAWFHLEVGTVILVSHSHILISLTL